MEPDLDCIGAKTKNFGYLWVCELFKFTEEQYGAIISGNWSTISRMQVFISCVYIPGRSLENLNREAHPVKRHLHKVLPFLLFDNDERR